MQIGRLLVLYIYAVFIPLQSEINIKTMFRILIVLIIGIVLGYALRRLPHIHSVDTSARYTICALLFVFGLSLGANASLMRNIGFYGLEAVVVALLGMAGSFGAARLFNHLMRKTEDKA